jgi:itaconate CoA-transferase
MSGLLEKLLVVSVEQAVAGPLCTARLADAGARVIKIERAEGDFARAYDHVVHGESAYFVWLNRGKESVVLDIKQSVDMSLLRRMIAHADVFVQNLAPGAARRLGLGSDVLRALHPRLITCDIRGYSEEGPFRDRKAYDLIVQCETALVAVSGGPTESGRVGVSVADISCGINAYTAVLEALLEREKTGHGKGVTVSLFGGLADWMTVPLLHQEYSGEPPPRMGINHATIAPYGAYTTGDGNELIISVQNEREWRSFCNLVLQRVTLAEDPRFQSNALRCVNRSDLSGVISGVFKRFTHRELTGRLTDANIAFGNLNSVADFARHPHLRRVTVDTPSGPVLLPAPPTMGRRTQRLGAVPALGAHTEQIRREFT